MLLIADPETAYVDPVLEVPTLSLICNVFDPVTRERVHPRPAAHRPEGRGLPEEHRASPTSATGARRPSSTSSTTSATTRTPSAATTTSTRSEGVWNTGRAGGPEPRLQAAAQGRLLPRARRPTSSRTSAREIILKLEEVGVPVEVHHHEVGTAGQAEIDMRFGTLTKMADSLMYYKYIIRNVARKHGKTATFMPKPIFGDNGSGMHCHQSLWKGETNLFWDEKGYGQISEMARYYIGGLLKHAPALLAICAPTTNSYRRLVPGYEAPVNLVYSQRNRSAAVRIPIYSKSPKSKRIEFRCPDPSTNPYLCFAAHAHGRARRHPEQDRPGRADRQGPLRPRARGGREGQEHARLARRGARRPREATTTSCSRATSSPRT